MARIVQPKNADAKTIFKYITTTLNPDALSKCLENPSEGLFYNSRMADTKTVQGYCEVHQDLLADLLTYGVVNKVVLADAVRQLNKAQWEASATQHKCGGMES